MGTPQLCHLINGFKMLMPVVLTSSAYTPDRYIHSFHVCILKYTYTTLVLNLVLTVLYLLCTVATSQFMLGERLLSLRQKFQFEYIQVCIPQFKCNMAMDALKLLGFPLKGGFPLHRYGHAMAAARNGSVYLFGGRLKK